MPIISLEATESSSVSSTRPAIIHKTEYEYFRIIGRAAAALRTSSRDYPELTRKNRVYFLNGCYRMRGFGNDAGRGILRSNRIRSRDELSRRRGKVCGSGIGSERKKGFHKAGPIFVAGGSAYLTATTFSLPRRKVRARQVPLGERRPSKCQPCVALSPTHLEHISPVPKGKSFDDASPRRAGCWTSRDTASHLARRISTRGTGRILRTRSNGAASARE